MNEWMNEKLFNINIYILKEDVKHVHVWANPL